MCNHVTIIVGTLSAKPFLPFSKTSFCVQALLKSCYSFKRMVQTNLFLLLLSQSYQTFPTPADVYASEINPSFPTGASEGTD